MLLRQVGALVFFIEELAKAFSANITDALPLPSAPNRSWAIGPASGSGSHAVPRPMPTRRLGLSLFFKIHVYTLTTYILVTCSLFTVQSFNRSIVHVHVHVHCCSLRCSP